MTSIMIAKEGMMRIAVYYYCLSLSCFNTIAVSCIAYHRTDDSLQTSSSQYAMSCFFFVVLVGLI